MGDEALVEAVLTDWRTAPVDERLRATLGFLRKLTLEPDELGPDDLAAVRRAGVSDDALRDAVYVAAAFNLIDRLADAVGAEPLSRRLPRDEVLTHAARFLAAGYA
jgi:alkylhydroperoxidase family enzyme